MVTAAFFILDKMPLTSNGKVDCKALPGTDVTTRWEASFVPPHTPKEQIIADIWDDVLGQQEIGIYDTLIWEGIRS
jgi:hypothetical protein